MDQSIFRLMYCTAGMVLSALCNINLIKMFENETWVKHLDATSIQNRNLRKFVQRTQCSGVQAG